MGNSFFLSRVGDRRRRRPFSFCFFFFLCFTVICVIFDHTVSRRDASWTFTSNVVTRTSQ